MLPSIERVPFPFGCWRMFRDPVGRGEIGWREGQIQMEYTEFRGH